MAMTLDTFTRVKKIMDGYGVPPEIWYPIAMAESTGDPNAHGDLNKGGTGSWGLFQLYTGGGQGGNHPGSYLTNIENNANIAGPYFKKAYEKVKGSYSLPQLAGEVAVRSGHPGGNVNTPVYDDRVLYNSIVSYAKQGIPSDLQSGSSTLYNMVGLADPADGSESALSTATDAAASVAGNGSIGQTLQNFNDFLAYLGVNASLILARAVLILIAIPVLLVGTYLLLKSLGGEA
jgi:hypothetical protein